MKSLCRLHQQTHKNVLAAVGLAVVGPVGLAAVVAVVAVPVPMPVPVVAVHGGGREVV